MSKRFNQQVAVISGGAEGLGKGIAERIASEGGMVFLLDRNKMLLEKTITELTGKGFMKRLGTVEEVAAISSWIVSREASFTTGFIFDISGGRATY